MDKKEQFIPFLVNKDGLPISKKTWDEMFEFCIKNNEEEKEKINLLRDYSANNLIHICAIDTPTPRLRIREISDPFKKLEDIQSYMSSFSYNYTGMQFYMIKRNMSMEKLRQLTYIMIHAALPIKCLEATIMAIFLTENQEEFKRFTLSFKSESSGNLFRHVVLGIYSNGKFGALGLSRRDDLMYRPLKFPIKGQLDVVYTQTPKLSLPSINYSHSSRSSTKPQVTVSRISHSELPNRRLTTMTKFANTESSKSNPGLFSTYLNEVAKVKQSDTTSTQNPDDNVYRVRI